jgi:hypothetical protein
MVRSLKAPEFVQGSNVSPKEDCMLLPKQSPPVKRRSWVSQFRSFMLDRILVSDRDCMDCGGVFGCCPEGSAIVCDDLFHFHCLPLGPPPTCGQSGQACVPNTCCQSPSPQLCGFGTCRPCIPSGAECPLHGSQICCKPGDQCVFDQNDEKVKCAIPG